MLLCSITINSVCRNDNRHIDDGTVIVNKTQPLQRRRQQQPLSQQQTATLLLIPTTLVFKSHAVRQLCSPVCSKPRCLTAMLAGSAQSHVARQFDSTATLIDSSARQFCSTVPRWQFSAIALR
jgi:hypothetical protein